MKLRKALFGFACIFVPLDQIEIKNAIVFKLQFIQIEVEHWIQPLIPIFSKPTWKNLLLEDYLHFSVWSFRSAYWSPKNSEIWASIIKNFSGMGYISSLPYQWRTQNLLTGVCRPFVCICLLACLDEWEEGGLRSIKRRYLLIGHANKLVTLFGSFYQEKKG